MTPRSHSSPGMFQSNATIDTDNKTPTHDDHPSDQEEETRPTHTAEIGTLKKLSVPGGTAWLGSSSGVYFVNTVRRAFSAAFVSQSNNSIDGSGDLDSDGAVPASEDIITGEDAAGRNFNGIATLNGSGNPGRTGWWLHDQDIHRRIIAAVGRPPANRKLAMDLVTTFFRQTHPLFPFLHGPKFLEDMNEIYAAMAQQPSQQSQRPHSSTRSPNLMGRRTNSAMSNDSNATTSISELGNIHAVDPFKLITFQIIINIAALSHQSPPQAAHTTSNSVPSSMDNNKHSPNTSLPLSSTIPSPNSLLTLILPLSTTPLLPTIQLLLSASLYLLSTIHLRHSSTLAGIILRLIYHAGLHRCPLRYASLTEQDCEIRKRIFWAAYAMDRHLSLALGDPNTFQDSDIDVCLSRNGGEGELHRAVARDLLSEEEKEQEVRLHFPRDTTGRVIMGDRFPPPPHQQKPWQSLNVNMAATGLEEDRARERGPPGTGQSLDKGPSTSAGISAARTSTRSSSNRTKQLREAALTAYVQYGKLTGRIIEIFHKSINFRFPSHDAIGFLTADIENWWNELPSTLTGEYNPGTGNGNQGEGEQIDPHLIEQHHQLTPFFTLLYHQLLLLLNRPRLSLDQSTAEFQQGLQVCIRASRNTLSALQKHKEYGQSMFLPGLLSAAWMSGLIIAFACQLGKYPKQRACSDIRSCVALLESMNIKLYTVKNCHKVLDLLLGNIVARKANANGYLPAARGDPVANHQSTPSGVMSHGPTAGQTRKRTRDSISMDNSEAEPSPKRDSLAGISPTSSDFRPPQPSFRSPEMRSNSAMSGDGNGRNPTSASASSCFPHQRQDSMMSTTSVDFPFNPPQPSGSGSFLRNMDFTSLNSINSRSGSAVNNTSTTNIGPESQTGNQQQQQRAGAALYADPQDMAFAQSSHSMGLPDLSSSSLLSMDDPMFWGNMDSNLFDVFGAVSWESMTGPVGPMASNGAGVWDLGSFGNPASGGLGE